MNSLSCKVGAYRDLTITLTRFSVAFHGQTPSTSGSLTSSTFDIGCFSVCIQCFILDTHGVFVAGKPSFVSPDKTHFSPMTCSR